MSEKSKAEELLLHTPSLSEFNYSALISLFPNAVTEILDGDGSIIRAIDADILAQEINCRVISNGEESYQFTWPGKKKAVLLANTPTNAAFHPCFEESINFDSTENFYIEGDSLYVLKLLREPYFGKIKNIYIVTPQNNEPFHTDWLNIVYPRLRAARDLLRDDGVIFVNCREKELYNLKKICDEIFGEINFIACFPSNLSQNSNRTVAFALSIKHAGKVEESLNNLYPLLFCETGKDRLFFWGSKNDLKTQEFDIGFIKLKLDRH